MKATAVALALAFLAGCAAPQPYPAQGEPTHLVYVVGHGWHTGLVLRAADIPEGALPGVRDFPGARYLEVGWGDRDYYQAPHPSVWLAVKALFWPTPSVLHVVGLRAPVERSFPTSDIVGLGLTARGFEHLLAYLRASYELDAAGKPIALGPGLYGDSRFYASRETFDLFRTCNVWTARALRAGGVPVAPALTAGGLLSALRPLGRTARGTAPR